MALKTEFGDKLGFIGGRVIAGCETSNSGAMSVGRGRFRRIQTEPTHRADNTSSPDFQAPVERSRKHSGQPMTYYVEDRFKNKIFNTTFAQMEQLVASLGWEVEQHYPEVTLCHMSGWCIGVYPSGVAILTLRGSRNEPWHMRCNSYEHVLELWTLLAAGKLDELGAAGWLPGYGA